MRRTFVVVLLVTAWVVALAVSAGAITGGSPDFGHPNAGAIIVDVDWGDGLGLHQEFWCSGSLLSEDAFLTANHCVDFFNEGVPDPVSALYVTFDQNLKRDPNNVWWTNVPESDLVPVDDWFMQPGWHCNTSTCYNDVAVLTLGESVTGIAPVTLPEAGFLTTASARGGLVGHDFVNVGYGAGELDRSAFSPNATFPWTGEREASTSRYMALTRNHLFLLEEGHATGGGGTCFGDSGGPVYFAASGEYANVVVAVNTSGDPVCKALSQRTRLDREDVLGFLAQFQ